MGKAELKINVSRSDKRVRRSLILETNSPYARNLNLTVDINVVHDNIIHPNENAFIRLFAEEEVYTETFYIISYISKDLKLLSIDDNNGKFDIEFKKLTDYSILLQEGSKGRPDRVRDNLNYDKIVSLWKIDIKIDYNRIKDDFDPTTNNRADYVFAIKANDEDFSGQELKLMINLRNHITAYPSTINIHLDAPSHSGRGGSMEEGFSRKFYLTSETGENFKVKNVYSEMKELSFVYDKDASGPRHTVELILSPSEKYEKQSADITVELEYDKQNIVKIPIFLLRRR